MSLPGWCKGPISPSFVGDSDFDGRKSVSERELDMDAPPKVTGCADLPSALEAYKAHLSIAVAKPRSRYEMHRAMRWLAQECGWKTIADITRESFVAHLHKLAEAGRTKKHIKNQRVLLRAFIDFCIADEKLGADPIGRVDIAVGSDRVKHRMRPFTVEESEKLITVAMRDADAEKPVSPAFYWRFAYYRVLQTTGGRRSELAGPTAVRRSDVDLDSPLPTITFTPEASKEGGHDRIPLTPEAVHALRWWFAETPDAPPDSPLFPRPVSFFQLHKDLRAAGIPHKHPKTGQPCGLHSFRHALAVQMARAGVSIVLASKVTRHRSHAILNQVYSQVDDSDKLDAIARSLKNISGTSPALRAESERLVSTDPQVRVANGRTDGKLDPVQSSGSQMNLVSTPTRAYEAFPGPSGSSGGATEQRSGESFASSPVSTPEDGHEDRRCTCTRGLDGGRSHSLIPDGITVTSLIPALVAGLEAFTAALRRGGGM